MEENFNWEDDLMTNSFQKQECHLAKLAKDRGKDYGKPIQGSESDIRSKTYQKQVIQEVVNICHIISEFGHRTKDGAECITFGELFRICENISNKCVGILQRGRKHRLLHFAGETLWQGADDKKIITLIRKNREIQVYYDYTKHLLPSNPEGNYWLDISGPRRSYYDWVTNVKELNPTTTAYCIQVNTPVNDDHQGLPARCFPLSHEDEILTRPKYLVEPRVIFKLCKPLVGHAPIVANLPLQFFDPCLWFDTEAIPDLPARETVVDVGKGMGIKLCSPRVRLPPIVVNRSVEFFNHCLWFETESLPIWRALKTVVDVRKEEPRPTIRYLVTSPPAVRKMKKSTPPPNKMKAKTPPPIWIRAAAPPPRKIKQITPPPRKVIVKIEKPVERPISPVAIRPVKINYDTEYRRNSIKFNRCTTMYKTTDPIYEQLKRGTADQFQSI